MFLIPMSLSGMNPGDFTLAGGLEAPVSPPAHQAGWQSYQTSYSTELRYVPLRAFPGMFEYLFIWIIINLKARQGK